ncbi:uncharacterized protein LOC109821806 [Asparagus officinalis]|uniref:uncharacterized protein LOC109821806 n=1 Tax=Asparagus officinalis TaxID=4686 RepID=UPI00098E14F1|nr:uncharacterized protein LOC109821806 [Asparagus officinalis]
MVTQAKKLVNASKKFVLLFTRPYEEQLSRVCMTTLSKLQEGDLDRLKTNRTWEENIVHVEKVFEVLQNGQLKLNGKKCKFGKDELVYLGFIVRKGQRRIDPSKVVVVTKWSTPRTVTEVRSFMEACQYLHKFIRHFLTYAAPLHGLMKVKVQFEWGRTHEEAFRLLKKKISEAPVLALTNL